MPRFNPSKPIVEWFHQNEWKPFRFQRQAWKAYAEGRSGLIHAPTGIGKTYAAWFGPVIEWLDETKGEERKPPPLRVLWITPMRALARDTVESLKAPLDDIGLPWTVELRSGDVSSSVKQRQRRRMPSALVTTPESLALLLSYETTRELFADLRCVIVDEWHELLGSKRGVHAELLLARLRSWFPRLRVWGLSATLGNCEEALDALMGGARRNDDALIAGVKPKKIEIRTLVPKRIDRFPWAGHLGLKMLPEVIDAIEQKPGTLLFTNTRSQTELWYQSLLEARPGWAGELALHHGSLDVDMRGWVEAQLDAGKLRCVVCTSSLDLGVDFTPVKQVIQVGSPKGVARLLQRAGRSGHQPGAVSEILCVPSHAFELVEFAAARDAVKRGEIEARAPLRKPLDLLAQHLVACAAAGGFEPDALYREVKGAYAFQDLGVDEWRWTLGFVEHGGESLKAYPDYHRIIRRNGLYQPASERVTRRYRISVGTIASDQHVIVKYLRGETLGAVEESFLARLKPGDRFVFAGRMLELVRLRDMKAIVKRAKAGKGIVPRWMGGYMPLSSQLAASVRRTMTALNNGGAKAPELKAVKPIFDIQAAWSHIPADDELLIERLKSRDGHHIFVYPLEGRLAHEGLAALLSYRLSRQSPRSISAAVTDYGFELLSPQPFDLDDHEWSELLSPERAAEDILGSLNASEMAKRQFRVIARVSGLVFNGYPYQQKTARQLQASSGLLYDVFERYDPDHLLLNQARREVMEEQLELKRIITALQRMQSRSIHLVDIDRLTPFSFPLWAERIRTHVSSESWNDRIQRMKDRLEAANQKESR